MKTAHRNASHAKRRFIADPGSAMFTIEKHQDMPAEKVVDIMTKLTDAFARMAEGSTNCELFDRLAAAINVGLIRAEAIDPLVEEVMVRAINAMNEADGIYGRHRRYGFTGPGLEAMKDGLQVYQEILSKSAPAQMEAALEESARRMLKQAGGQS